MCERERRKLEKKQREEEKEIQGTFLQNHRHRIRSSLSTSYVELSCARILSKLKFFYTQLLLSIQKGGKSKCHTAQNTLITIRSA